MRRLPLPILLALAAATAHAAPITLLIDKTHHRLFVLNGRRIAKTYPCVFGGDPVNDKRFEGDSRTPEGNFKISRKYPHRLWSRFMLLNYPITSSWAKFRRAKREHRIPPNATIGGLVGIHGVPAGYDSVIDRGQNWTLGCISLKTADIKDLYSLCKVGTPVRIIH
jgi:murein L,D-transpeptidase YafK